MAAAPATTPTPMPTATSVEDTIVHTIIQKNGRPLGLRCGCSCGRCPMQKTHFLFLQFSIVGGKDTALRAVYVKSVKPASAAAVDGKVSAGDKVLLVNANEYACVCACACKI
jgi:hypothetical protein